MTIKTNIKRRALSLMCAVATVVLGGMVLTTATGCDHEPIETAIGGRDVAARIEMVLRET